MDFKQVIPFDQSKGGNTPNLCLENVSKGFQIAERYNSAWQAWENTIQHPNSNVPAGLDIPLFYSYTATIDGVPANYGHINVRLANGTVWSDGNIYPSIAAYLAQHTPKFVGWGESVNGATIIKGEEPMSIWNNGDTYNLLFHAVSPAVAEAAKAANFVGYFGLQDGMESNQAFNDIISSPQFDEMVAAARVPANYVPYSGPQLFEAKS